MNKHLRSLWFGFAFAVCAWLAAGCGGADPYRKLTPIERQIYLEPALVSTALSFDRVAQGYDSACMLTPAGEAWCWGSDETGQLGALTAKSCQSGLVACSWQPVRAQASLAFASLSPSRRHSCGIDVAGKAWCWGRNPYGVLGRGLSGASLVPAAVTGGHRFASLAVGGNFNCGLTSAGAAGCWGFALSLGDGVQAHSDVPVAVAGGHVFASVSAGYQHACGLTSDGMAWCWGVSFLTGSGTEDESKVPVAVAGGHRFRVLQAGGTATCAISLAGLPLCWGLNANGAVGQNNLGP